MENEVKKTRGGARPGAGRPRNPTPKHRHTVYCDYTELALIKVLLQEKRKVDKSYQKFFKLRSLPKNEKEQAIYDDYFAKNTAFDALTVKQLNEMADKLIDEKINND